MMSSTTNNTTTDLYAVMAGGKLGGIYRFREDANTHAEVAGGVVVVQQVKNDVPAWVKTMAEASKEKAQLQGGNQQQYRTARR